MSAPDENSPDESPPAESPLDESPPAEKRWRWPRRADLWWVLPIAFGGWIGVMRIIGAASGANGMWISDSRFYLYYALIFGGSDAPSAMASVTSFFTGMGLGLPGGMPMDQLSNFALFAGRPLYAMLSGPLVTTFGYAGMFVVPIAAYAAILPLLYAAVRTAASTAASTAAKTIAGTVAGTGAKVGAFAPSVAAVAAFVIFLLTGPTTYLVRPMPESLAVAGMAAWALTLPWHGELSRTRMWTLVAVVFAAGLSRQLALLIVVPAVFLALWAHRAHRDGRVSDGERHAWRTAAIATTAATVAAMLVSQLFGSGSASALIRSATGSKDNVGEAVLFYFGHAASQFAAELVSIAYDPPTLILFVVAVLGWVFGRRTVVPWLVSGALLGWFAMFLIVPFATHLRLVLPTMVLLAIAAAITMTRAATARGGERAGMGVGEDVNTDVHP